jgi:RNA polymerase sigma factor (sigma-70 family)
MKAMNDHDLIHEFAATRSEQAFRRLVDRHCDLVFSVAGRVTRDPDLARDVSQQVFCKLAAKPNSVPAGVPLAAWLHRTCRSLAIDLVRSEEARRKREASLSHPSAMNSETTPDWSRLEPVIDSLIDELPELDRRAVVLRFYERRSHGAIGAALGLSEEAARKRLDRALDRLRGLLAKRGIATTSAALATILPAHATGPAPAGLAASLSSTALSTATVTTASTSSILAIIMSHKAVIAGASLLLLAGVTAIAVPRMTGGRRANPINTASAPETAKHSESPPPAVSFSAAKSRTADANARLVEKYGDSRTKLSAHIFGELVGLLEDSVSVMELAHEMELGEYMTDDPVKALGEAGKGLTLTNEQKKQIAELHTETFKREGESVRSAVADLKKQPAKMMEHLLARDAVKRGQMTRAEYDQLAGGLDFPELDMSEMLGGSGDVGPDDDQLDQQAFVDGVLAILDEEQARIFQEGLAVHAPEEAKEVKETEEEFTTLEEYEQQLTSHRKMIQGALQLMEGITGSGVIPDKTDK